jgi:hypothetical protein
VSPYGFIIRNRPPPCPFKIIVLAVLKRPEKPHQAEHQRQGNEKHQNFQLFDPLDFIGRGYTCTPFMNSERLGGVTYRGFAIAG